jgi:predicted GTPase
MERRKVVIMGAAGRDFHDFNVHFRDREDDLVVAFTATQIPNIEGRLYPPALSGPLYPEGIRIMPERQLPELIARYGVDEVVFAYSDVSHEQVMHAASLALACGSDFRLLGPKATELKAAVPVVSVGAVRTGAGKSQTTRKVAALLKERGLKIAVIRHAMPYGDLEKQIWQRFATMEDLDRHHTTIEEREEYEPHIRAGNVVYAGVDYLEILRRAEAEAEVILWDGGNNDTPFIASDLHIVLVDPLRPGHEVSYHPGEQNLRMADVVIVNKVDSATAAGIEQVRHSAARLNPDATLILAESPVTLEDVGAITGKRVLIVEDGPTTTHGDMPYGAGYVAAKQAGALEIVDPRRWAVGTVREVYEKYPKVGPVLPAVGYSEEQVADLARTIELAPADVVLIATPIDLRRVVKLDKPAVRAFYELKEISTPSLADIIDRFVAEVVRA